MYVIGLTGNIATGKSTIGAMLRTLGAEVVDADKLAHWVMRAGTDVNQRIAARFGLGVLTPEGEIDRARLGQIVFADPAALRDLEALVHPGVIREALLRRALSQQRVFVIEAIKLLEADLHCYCDAVWLVIAAPAQQLERLKATRHLTTAEAELRLGAQPPVEPKLARADVVIDNSGSLQQTWRQVILAWNAIPDIVRVGETTPWPGAEEHK